MTPSNFGTVEDLYQNKWTILLWAGAFYVSSLIVHAKFLAPTANVPGALIDKISSIRWFINGLTGRKMYFVDRQLRSYGPLVEVSPNKLACSSPSEIKTIYGSHEWRKSRFYSDFGDFQGTASLFSEPNPVRATMLRRCFLPAFSRANLVGMSTNIFGHLDKFLLKLAEFESKGKAMDTYRWFRYLTFEVVTDIGFGAEYDMISNGEVDHPFVNDFDDSTSWGILKSFIGFIILRIPKTWFPNSVRHWAEAEDRTEKHARGGLDKWREQKSQGVEGHRVDILQRMIDHGEKNPEDRLTEKELITEIMEIMLAGADTTAATVTYACYELTRFPAAQQKLRQALKDAIPDPAAEITLEKLEAIPYLDWTVKEMLRMHPTLPSCLERVVPAQGATVAGYKLKAGSIVCMQAFTQHLQEEVFVHAETFEPQRWENETPAMKANLLAFSSGPRSCVGQNLATTQMKIHMGMILRKYRIEAHPDTTPASMEPLDFFQGKPRSGRCLLYFKKDE